MLKACCIVFLLVFIAAFSCKKSNTKDPRIESNVAGEYGNGVLTWWNGTTQYNSYNNSTRAFVTYIQKDSVKLSIETNAPVPSIKDFNLKLEYRYDTGSASWYNYKHYALDQYTTPFFSGHSMIATISVYASETDRLSFIYDSFYNGQRIHYANGTFYKK